GRVTAPLSARRYGSPNGPLTPAITGFVLGQSAAALTTQPTCATTADANSLGSGTPDAITGGGGGGPNYTSQYVEGALTVTAVQLTVTGPTVSRPYGSANG